MESNTKFFSIYDKRPYNGCGFELKVFDVRTDFTTQLATVPTYTSLSFTCELNGPGAGSVTIDLQNCAYVSSTLLRGFKDILSGSHLWKIYDNGVHIGSFFGEKVEKTLIAESGNPGVTISGPGEAGLLKRGVVLPPGVPNAPEYFWKFDRGSIISHWLELLAACQDRGTIPYITTLFTANKDSANEDWEDADSTTAWPPSGTSILGQNLLDLLNTVTGQDSENANVLTCDWIMWPGFRLDIRPYIGNDRSKFVVFFDSAQIFEESFEEDTADVANYIVVRDEYGKISVATDASSKTEFGQVEFMDQRSNVTKPEIRDKVAKTILELRKNSNVTWTLSVPAYETGRVVFRDYTVGDTVRFSGLDDAGALTNIDLRIVALTISDQAEGTPSLELTLQSKAVLLEKKLERTLNSLVGNIGTGALPSLADVNIPSVPSNGDVLGFDSSLGSSGAWTNGPFGGRPPVVFSVDEPSTTDCPVGYFWAQLIPEE